MREFNPVKFEKLLNKLAPLLEELWEYWPELETEVEWFDVKIKLKPNL
jgi:hypothetical protein